MLGEACLQAPVVQVVVKIAIAWGKLKLVQELLIIHDIHGIEDIEAIFLGLEERVLHESHWSVLGGHIVQKICRLKLVRT